MASAASDGCLSAEGQGGEISNFGSASSYIQTFLQKVRTTLSIFNSEVINHQLICTVTPRTFVPAGLSSTLGCEGPGV